MSSMTQFCGDCGCEDELDDMIFLNCCLTYVCEDCADIHPAKWNVAGNLEQDEDE